MNRKAHRAQSHQGSGPPHRPGAGASGPSAFLVQAEALAECGRLAEAETLLRSLLSMAPRDHAALHLLGLITHGKGDHAAAIALYRQAIAINGRVACYHGNLGNAYLEAESAEPAKAARSFRRVLALEPGSALAHFGLGLALIGQKDYRAAAKELEAAARARPDHADTELNLGIALIELKRADEAIAHCRRAIALNPGYAGNHLHLGVAFRVKGDLTAAHAHLARAIALDPKLAEAHYQLGITLRGLSRMEEAMGALQQAAALSPGMAEAIGLMGGILYDQDRLDEAIGCYERALRINPRLSTLHHGMGYAVLFQGRLEEARALFTKALELDPADAENYVAMGRTYEYEGRFEEAIAWQGKAIAHQADHASAHYYLAMMHSAADRKSRIGELERGLAEGPVDPGQRAVSYFALGKLYEEEGEYDRAFRAFKAGNDQRKQQYPHAIEDYEAAFDRQIAAFGRELFRAKGRIGSESERPVFVVGLPRSGTSLVEQILASHPQIHGHGELEHFRLIAHSLPERLGGEAYPECVARLEQATTLGLAQEYLDRLEPDAGGSIRSVNKMPDNFRHLGLIALMFPQARVIHCTRDARDTCLSCYFHDFGPRLPFTWDQEQLARYYLGYRRLMAHWHASLPGAILDVPYEGLVAGQEQWSRRLVEFVGLSWDERCLSFYETERPVLTSSAWQVRQPIYSSSIGRWRHYAQHLGPLLAALGEPGNAPGTEGAAPGCGGAEARVREAS